MRVYNSFSFDRCLPVSLQLLDTGLTSDPNQWWREDTLRPYGKQCKCLSLSEAFNPYLVGHHCKFHTGEFAASGRSNLYFSLPS